MLRIKLIVVDRTRSSFLREGEMFYLKRLRRYVQAEWVEVKPARILKGRPSDVILEEEADGIMKRLGPRDCLVALDRSGRAFTSEGLAEWLQGLSTRIAGSTSFVIGGPLGLSQALLHRAHTIISLSELTLTHEMSRLVLLEQLYRALTILRGEKYHK